jgi:hypothetical protein
MDEDIAGRHAGADVENAPAADESRFQEMLEGVRPLQLGHMESRPAWHSRMDRGNALVDWLPWRKHPSLLLDHPTTERRKSDRKLITFAASLRVSNLSALGRNIDATSMIPIPNPQCFTGVPKQRCRRGEYVPARDLVDGGQHQRHEEVGTKILPAPGQSLHLPVHLCKLLPYLRE